MKKEPKAVYIIENGGYTELTYEEFCHREQICPLYADKLFLPLYGSLMEVSKEDYEEYYRQQQRDARVGSNRPMPVGADPLMGALRLDEQRCDAAHRSDGNSFSITGSRQTGHRTISPTSTALNCNPQATTVNCNKKSAEFPISHRKFSAFSFIIPKSLRQKNYSSSSPSSSSQVNSRCSPQLGQSMLPSSRESSSTSNSSPQLGQLTS